MKGGNHTTLASVALLACLGCGNSTLELIQPDLGLLAHWALDEGAAGSVAADSSGFNLTATPSETPPTPTREVAPVKFRDPHGLSFNGQDQWLALGNPPLLNAGGAITIAAWVRPSDIAGFHNIIAHGYRITPSQEVALRIASGSYQFIYWNGVDHDAQAIVAASDIGAWVHLCGVFDGSAYSLYRNGVLAASTPDGTAIPPNIDALWAIGARVHATEPVERLFQGDLDEVRVYGRALTAAEIAALYRR